MVVVQEDTFEVKNEVSEGQEFVFRFNGFAAFGYAGQTFDGLIELGAVLGDFVRRERAMGADLIALHGIAIILRVGRKSQEQKKVIKDSCVVKY